MRRLTTGIIMLACVLTAYGQTMVSGTVTDSKSGRPIPHVSIAAEGEGIHTVTNEDGHFTLKTAQRPQVLHVSHIGYQTLRHKLGKDLSQVLKLEMTPSSVLLDEIVVSADDALEIVKAAMSHITKNYPKESELMRCFYRETARRGSRFISVAEAVTDMYKTGYGFGPDHDAVAILKGRRLMSLKSSDTLGVKIQGGPVAPLMVDIAKNRDYLLNDEMLALCTFQLKQPVLIGNRPHHVVSVTPLYQTSIPMMEGLLYIDRETLTFSRAELQLDMSDWHKAADYMLVHKPVGVRFRPRELSVTVVFQTDELGISHMRYVRSLMRFHCDWKRKLFSSSYTAVSEMVVTSILGHGQEAKRPRGRSSFGIKDRFYDHVEYFVDPDFWADYNIIEPTEDLEHAIEKLYRKAKRTNP